MPPNLARFFELSADLLCITTLEGRFTLLNPAWEDVLGWTCEELKGRPFLDFVHPDDVPETLRAMEDLSRGQKVFCFENRYRCRDGSYRWFAWTAAPVATEGTIYAIARDITERRQDEEGERRRVALKAETRERERTAVELGRINVCLEAILAEGGTFPEASPGLLRTMCRTLDWDVAELWIPDTRFPRLRLESCWYDGAAGLGELEAAGREMAFAQGEGLPGLAWKSGEPVSFSDLSKHAGFARASLAGQAGLNTGLAIPAKTGGRLAAVVCFYSRAVRELDPNQIRLMASIGNQLGLFAGKKRVEAQLLQSQKLEAVGRLAGGIAHDFNNLISVILGYSEMLGERLKPGAPMKEEMDEIHKAGTRAAALTRQLLAFSRQQVLVPQVLDLNLVVTGIEKMIRRILGEDISLHFRTAPDLHPVKADPGQIEQVIMNLVVNARDAMPQGGRLTIETANVVLDEAYAVKHLDARPGPHSMLAVSDSGTGMDREIQSHIFDPFFTTKEPGKGTGLGLATVFGIVKQSGGHIWVYSEPGQGATFKIYLPSAAGAAPARPPTRVPNVLRGRETILLVEDDDAVRAVARLILASQGYRLLEAKNAAEAMLLCERHSEPIHLLLTDVVMPETSGPRLAGKLAAIRPLMKVLCMSGYSDEAIVHHGLIEAGVAFLQKPLTPESLSRKVREVLDAPAGG